MLQATIFRETRDSARELKFLLPLDRAHAVLQWARERLNPDPHAGGPSGDEYRTTTIYFDTPDRAVYRRQGSYGRSKYRIRRYGTTDVAFLERKLRTRALLSKHRIRCGLDALAGSLGAGSLPARRPRAHGQADGWAGQWFADRVALRGLTPVCQVSYRRRALIGSSAAGPMRLTFDDQLVAQPHSVCAFAPDHGVPVLAGSVIVEMKYCDQSPALFRQLAQDFSLSPAQVSKYRLSMDAIDRVYAFSPATAPAVDEPALVDRADSRGLANA